MYKSSFCSIHSWVWQPTHLNNKENIRCLMGFPSGSVVKNLPANAGDTGNSGLILGSGRSSAGGNGDPFQYSCLENPMDREAWLATVQRVTKSWTGLTTHTHTHAHTHTCKDRDRQAPRPGCGVLLGFWSFLCTCPGTKTFQEVSCLGERCSGE